MPGVGWTAWKLLHFQIEWFYVSLVCLRVPRNLPLSPEAVTMPPQCSHDAKELWDESVQEHASCNTGLIILLGPNRRRSDRFLRNYNDTTDALHLFWKNSFPFLRTWESFSCLDADELLCIAPYYWRCFVPFILSKKGRGLGARQSAVSVPIMLHLTCLVKRENWSSELSKLRPPRGKTPQTRQRLSFVCVTRNITNEPSSYLWRPADILLPLSIMRSITGVACGRHFYTSSNIFGMKFSIKNCWDSRFLLQYDI